MKIYIVYEESLIDNDFHKEIRAAFKNREDAIAFIHNDIEDLINDENSSYVETYDFDYDYEVVDEEEDNNYVGWNIVGIDYYE